MSTWVWVGRIAAAVTISLTAYTYSPEVLPWTIAIFVLGHALGYACAERELKDLIRQNEALLDVLENKSPGGDYATW